MLPDRGTMGWDVGGAHLKMAWKDGHDVLRHVEIRATPLWQGLESLGQAIREIAKELPVGQCEHRVTMTAELVDLFNDRQSGVRELVGQLRTLLPSDTLLFYAGPKGFVPAAEASAHADQIASANWLATASFAASAVSAGIVIDVGSTTSDLLPFEKHHLRNRGFTDRERLSYGEMIYAGVVRTPLMAVTRRVPFRGEWVSLASEHFATTADVYRILGELPEDADLYPSADGKDHSVPGSMRRLARMIGADRADGSDIDWYRLAAFFADRQMDMLSLACQRLSSLSPNPSTVLIGAGVGRFLVERVADRLGHSYIDMEKLLAENTDYGVIAANCAPAVALLHLDRRRSDVCA
ncbi:MAG: hypothetical protein OQL28_00780 [Sedimenticola sp.]|nr:hypothetical protein [Sedimenticola sp.]